MKLRLSLSLVSSLSRDAFGLVLLLAVVSPAARAYAQTPTPAVAVQGTVLDATRAPIPGARVEMAPGETATTPGTVTNGSGAFTLMLPPGEHTLQIEADGFDVATERVLAPSSGAGLEIVMRIAGVHTSVTVTAGTSALPIISSATKTETPLRDVPQSVTVVTSELIKDQMMMSVGDVMRYVPGVTVHQGENNRDQVIIRGNSSSSDFFVDGVRDDAQYYRDLYNLDRVETLKGPNAMTFGRGGTGGVVNRVSKEAGSRPTREVALQGGMYGNKRVSADLNEPVNGKLAFRLNGFLENSESFRDTVYLKRHGVTPTMTFAASDRTKIVVRYEYLNDKRGADRGVPSYRGRPADIDPSTFFGNPDLSHVRLFAHVASGQVEHRFGAITVRNHTVLAHYDRFYQNFVPGLVTADKAQVSLSSYNNASVRTNVFNQTDVIATTTTGTVGHTLMAGAELGRQWTDLFRNTGFFNNSDTSILVPYLNPRISTAVAYRQLPSDGDSRTTAGVAAVYAQDQIAISRYLQVLAGFRVDRFDLAFVDNRNGLNRDRTDVLGSPRAGIVVKPVEALSLFSSYSMSYLPGSGDQFNTLTVITDQLEPEQLRNYEVGVKWDATPGLAVTTALYRLNRTNTRSTDPNDPTRIVQTGSQRTNGYEFGVNGHLTTRWSVAGGYTHQNAYVTNATAAAVAGAHVAQVPHDTLSLWNSYQVHPRVSAGVGVLQRTDMFATIDNTVTLPGYVRVDAAGFVTLSRLSQRLRLQVNVENVLDTRYFINADSNSNISPGFPRTIRSALTISF